MTQSEFVRTMVQAGRRDLEMPDAESSLASGTAGETDSTGDEMRATVLSELGPNDHLPWEELLERLTEDVEERLHEIMESLQSEGRVRYSRRDGGYTLAEGPDE